MVALKGKRPPPLPFSEILIASIGGLVGFGIIAFLALEFKSPILIASLGASAALIYSVPDAALSQPRNVIGGHILSALMGVICVMTLGSTWLALSLAVGLSIFVMLITETLHAPGGATAAVAVLTHQSFLFILMPVALGAVILVLVALVVNNLFTSRTYPTYWL